MSDALKAKTFNEAAGDERRQLIAEAAYYRAVNRGFQNGDPVDDWLAAEREIDALSLSRPARAAARKAEFVARPAKTPKTGNAGTDAGR